MVETADDSRAPAVNRFDEMAGMPGHLLRRCQQIAVSIFLKECRDFDLTPLQYAVLSALHQHGALDQVRIGGLVALDRTTVGVVVTKLERRGLIERRQSETDRRSKRISITASGRGLIARMLPAVRAAQDRIVGPLEGGERQLFLDFLRRIAEANNAESRAPFRQS